MGKEEKEQRDEPRHPFEGMPFAEQMRKMMAGKEGGCDCAQMMALMKASCCGGETDPEEPSQSKVADKRETTDN